MGKYGFVYIWFDRKHRRFYVGCHWGFEDDGYVCSSPWMMTAYKRRPQDFKRRILRSQIQTRPETYEEEQRWLNLIKESEIKIRYYNLNIRNNNRWHKYDESIKTVGQKISASKKGKKRKPFTEEQKKRISEGKKAAFKRKPVSDEWKRNISIAKTGIPIHTDEWKRQNSIRLKKQWAEGVRV